MRTGVWIREDLRCFDNTALTKACLRADDGVIAFYVVSPEDFIAHDVAPIRIHFIAEQLRELQTSLAALNIPLCFIEAVERKNIPQLITTFCEQHGIDAVYYNEQYEIDEQRRDQAVNAMLSANGIAHAAEVDQVLFAPGTVLTQQHHYYTVFTPFKRQALTMLQAGRIRLLPVPPAQSPIPIQPMPIPNSLLSLADNRVQALWPVGEAIAQQRLRDFIKHKIEDYLDTRDFPALNNTSQLSPYLASGLLSVRECLAAAIHANDDQLTGGNPGITTWINELLWREFYKHITAAFPRVCMNRPFKPVWEQFTWDNDPDLFAAWCEGRTGYPIVDAAMRQLNQTGWMHNRLRMVVAMFLTKDCLIDWRWGERYFMQHLIDGDFSANNGGWQWSAGSGTDAAPYFRVFNPITQSERFDPDGDFIKQFCPECSSFDKHTIHFPDPLLRAAHDYPAPIVDHSTARNNFLARYKRDCG